MNAPCSFDALLLTKPSIGKSRLFGLPRAVRRALNSSCNCRKTFLGEKNHFFLSIMACIENTFSKDVLYVLPLHSPDPSTIKYVQHVSTVYEYYMF